MIPEQFKSFILVDSSVAVDVHAVYVLATTFTRYQSFSLYYSCAFGENKEFSFYTDVYA